MAKVCTVCSHPQREAIERAIVSGESCYSISARYSPIGRMSVQRHKDDHLPETLARAQDAAEVASADKLLSEVRRLHTRAWAILDSAEKGGDLRTALGAIREARGNIELLAKMIGQLDERTVVNVSASPEWVMVQSALVKALGPYPEARIAVADAIAELMGTENDYLN